MTVGSSKPLFYKLFIDDDSPVKKLELLLNDIKEGKIDARAIKDSIHPQDEKILVLVNEILDILVGHLKEAGNFIEKIGKGEIQNLNFTQPYKGELKRIKDGITGCSQNLDKLNKDLEIICENHRNNDFNKRLDSFQGIFGDISNKINEIISIHTNKTL